MSRRIFLAPETIDGIEFGLRLEMAARLNPQIAERNRIYREKRKVAKDLARELGRDETIRRLKAHNPGYILDLLSRSEDDNLFERYAGTFWREPYRDVATPPQAQPQDAGHSEGSS